MEWNKISRKLIINYEYSMNLKNISDRTKIIIFLSVNLSFDVHEVYKSISRSHSRRKLIISH